MFIVFEGIDGCGKSTQAKLLANHFNERGEETLLTFEPGNTLAGKKLREMILTDRTISLHPRTELLLFNADRVEHVEKVIRPALALNKVVISDRYIYSTIAYQVGGRGFTENIINFLNDFTTDNLIPDHVFYIDLSPEIALARITEKDKFEDEKLEFYNKTANKYRQLTKKHSYFHQLDGTKSIINIQNDILKFF